MISRTKLISSVLIILGSTNHGRASDFAINKRIILKTPTRDVKIDTNTLKGRKVLTEDSMSQNVRKMEYAVRGKVVIAADNINEKLKSVDHSYPFNRIVYTNIGNPHSLGQKPLTWPRQVLALVELPNELGIDHPNVSLLFPADAIRRAREIKKELGGVGTGAYSHSQGVEAFRNDIVNFLLERDDAPAFAEDIFMTNGASSGIELILSCLVANQNSGVMIPIPQYPIYSGTIDLLGGVQIGYYLDEENGWGVSMEGLKNSLADAISKGVDVRAFVLINPGNPTGQVLSEKAVQDIVRFCSKNNLVLLADEVYQDNIYDNSCKFTSCKRAAHDTGILEKGEIELISFHSTSKGLMGECGRRGGYMELVGLDEDVKNHIYKLASSRLCSTVSGQIMTSLMVKGPDPGDESYESHKNEKKKIFESLKRRAKLVSEGLNAISGFSCQPAKGALYCFPRVEMPPGAIKAANKMNITPDSLYAISLLKSTGICVVPASGFRQKDGRYGFRTTFLPPEEEMKLCVQLIEEHYTEFLKQYV